MTVDMSFGQTSLFKSLYILGTPVEWTEMGESIRKAIRDGDATVNTDPEGSPNPYEYRARRIIIRKTDEAKAWFRIIAPDTMEITGPAHDLEVVARNMIVVGHDVSYWKIDDLILGDYIAEGSAEANCHASSMAPGSPPSRYVREEGT